MQTPNSLSLQRSDGTSPVNSFFQNADSPGVGNPNKFDTQVDVFVFKFVNV
jgi:hypothetical protein